MRDDKTPLTGGTSSSALTTARMNHSHRIIPISLLIVAIPIVLLAAFFLFAVIFTHDEPRPDDSLLFLPNVVVADTDNAFVEMQRIENAHSFPSEPDPRLVAAVNDYPGNEAYAATVITDHAADITLFRQAAGKFRYQDQVFASPTTIDLDTEIFPVYSSYRQVAQVAALEAESRARNGDIQGGLDEAKDVVRFGHTMENGQGALITYLVASSIKQTGLTGLRHIALNTAITTAQAKETAQKLEDYRDSRDGQANAMKMEYVAYKNFLQKNSLLGPLLGSYSISVDSNGRTIQRNSRLGNFLDYSGLSKFYYHPNQTWRYKVEQMTDGVRNSEADCTIVDVNPPRTFPVQYPNATWIFKPNAIGKILASLGEVSLGGLSTKRCNESVAISATEATLGSRAFTAENGRLPASWSDIVPKYLDAVPKDPYNGQPLAYSADQKLVYSVGPDRKDLGGSPVSVDWQHSSNPSFALSQ